MVVWFIGTFWHLTKFGNLFKTKKAFLYRNLETGGSNKGIQIQVFSQVHEVKV